MFSSPFISQLVGMKTIFIVISLRLLIVSSSMVLIFFFFSILDISIYILTIFSIFIDLIHFNIPRGFNVTVSSQPTDHSFTSYTLSDLGFVSGSITYLYTSKPLVDIKTSREICLKDAIAGYKILEPLKKQEDPMYWEVWKNGVRIDTRGKDQFK